MSYRRLLRRVRRQLPPGPARVHLERNLGELARVHVSRPRGEKDVQRMQQTLQEAEAMLDELARHEALRNEVFASKRWE